MLKKIFKTLGVFVLLSGWFLSGWPIKVQDVQAAAPAYRASGTFTFGTGTITPPYPAGMAANDICLLVTESENQAISLSSAQGFVEVPTWSPQSAGTAVTNPASRLAVFWKRTVGSDTAPIVADSGDHTTGQIHCFSGVITSGNPWDTGAGGNDSGVNDTTGTIPGATTTVVDTLVVLITSSSYNGTSTAQCSAWTNANLTSLTERTDNTNTAGLGGGHCLATGTKAATGAYTTTTVTLAQTSYKGAVSLALKPAPEVPGIAGSLGKTTDGWAGAVPVYGTLTGGLSQGDYPYARAQVVTAASQTFYTAMTWNVGNSRFEGTIYLGSNYCTGCDDPTLGTFTVTVQLDNNAGFPSIDYSASAVTFSTSQTRKRSSMDNAQNTNYTDFNAIWSTDHWNISISDYGFAMDAGTGTNFAVAVPILPTTSSPSNFTVAYNGSSISGGSAQSTSNAWWYDSGSHTLYVQFASLTTTLVDVDITFDSDTDLFATRYNWTYTYDMGSREFSNGIYIANQYLTTFIYGFPQPSCSGNECEGAGMQAESRAHHTTGGADESTDCMERIAVHVDDTPRSDGTTYYQYDTKWKASEWASWITSQSNSQIVIETNSDDTASTGWAQQLNNHIAAHRTQTYYTGKRYIKNVYEFTNNDSVSHKYPMVWEREQWHGTDRQTNDHGRFYGQSSDVVMEQRVAMSGFTCPWQTAYDSGTYINMGLVYDKNNLPDYGIFAVEPFLAPTTAEWPISITNPHATQTTDQTGFEKTFASVGAGSTVSFTFWHVHNAESSWADIASAMDADCTELNQSAAVVSVSVGDASISYGIVPEGTAKSTLELQPADTQTALNNGNVTEKFSIKTSNATGGTQWTIGSLPGTNVFVHEFSINGGSGWTKFTAAESYQTLATGIAASGTQNFDLRVTVPNTTSDYQEKSIAVTILAEQQ